MILREVGEEVDDVIEGGEPGDDEGGSAVGQVVQDDGFDLRFAEIMGKPIRLWPGGDISDTSLDVNLVIEKA